MNLVLINVILVATFWLSPIFCASQENTVELISNKPVLEIEDNIYLKSKLCGYQNFRLYSSETVNGKIREFYYYNTSKSRFVILKVRLNKKNKRFFYDRILSLGLIKNNVLVLTNNHIVLYHINEKNELTLERYEKNTDNYNVCKSLGENFFLYVNYKFHPLDAKYQHVWAIYDLKNQKINKQMVMPIFDINYTFFVNSWIDTYGDKIAYAHSSEYKIYFFNESLTKTDSIISPNPIIDVSENFNELDLGSREGISNFRKIDDSLNTRIRKVFFVNDSSLLILLKIKNSDSLQLDVWSRKQGKWQLTKNNKYTTWYKEKERYNEKELKSLSELYQNVNDIYINDQGEFEIWYYPYMENIVCDSFNSNSHFFSIQNKIILNHETKIGVKLFGINCN